MSKYSDKVKRRLEQAEKEERTPVMENYVVHVAGRPVDWNGSPHGQLRTEKIKRSRADRRVHCVKVPQERNWLAA